MEVIRLLRKGAEADLYLCTWHGMRCVAKVRVSKSYRRPELDDRLRRERTRHEARMLSLVRSAGIRTPHVLDVDLERFTIVMEHLDGHVLRDLFNAPEVSEMRKAHLAREIGVCLSALHESGIAHGDLTTSNMILSGGEICFIDLSLSSTDADLEEMGVDLRLAREALESAHPGLNLFEHLLEGYSEWRGAGEAIGRLEEIDRRGRYR
jgi:Kae1-associated kinase Bud32